MKKFVAASALLSLTTLSQAAIIPVSVDIAGTAYATANSVIVGTATGTYDSVSGVFTVSGSYNADSGFSDYDADATWTGSGLSVTQENTSCTNNGGLLNACLGLAAYNVPPLLLNTPYDIGVTTNTLDAGGNGILFSDYMVNVGTAGEANYQVTYTFTGQPVPVPAAAWLFGSALLGLVGVSRKRR